MNPRIREDLHLIVIDEIEKKNSQKEENRQE
jgi:hypothetical protein